jgi:hypothetical protein
LKSKADEPDNSPKVGTDELPHLQLTETEIAELEACFGTYIRDGDVDIDWLIPEIVHPGITCVTGQPEVGKTTLLVSMVKGLLEGKWLGLPTALPPGFRILFGCEDRGSARRVRRAFDGDPRVVVMQLDNWNTAKMSSVIRRGQIGLVVLDSLYAIVSNVNDQEECGEFTRALQRLAVPVVVVHHQAKMGARGPSGAQGYRAAYRQTIEVKQKSNQGDELVLDLAISGNDVASTNKLLQVNRLDHRAVEVSSNKPTRAKLSGPERAANLGRLALDRGLSVADLSHNDIAAKLVGGRQDQEDGGMSAEVAGVLGMAGVKFRTVANLIKDNLEAFMDGYGLPEDRVAA